ncbi:MAG: nucleotidyl transferase AbiEii/AbiGii toxin family protein [Bacteroidales bacterium]|nr:nucleotidyl transferase AbiEii/AbiGii toxin family protein [Bacteroidales bacterium]
MSLDLGNVPPVTSSLFQRLARESFMSSFSLVGGTALSLQLGHRQSEDLDFIFDGEKINSIGIKRFIAKLFPDYRLIREEKGYQLDFLLQGVKLTFFSTAAVLIPFPVKEHTIRYGTLNIANVSAISTLKMATISQRCTIRDYYDLYYVSKFVIPLAEIYKTTKALIPNLSPITYSETIVYIMDIPETSVDSHLFPKEIVSKEQIAEYFIEEIKKMKGSHGI